MLIGTSGLFAVSALGPVLATDFGTSASITGLLISIVFACAGLCSKLAGGITDRWGPFLPMFVGGVLAAAALVAVTFAGTRIALVVAVVFVGPCLAVGNPTSNAIIGRLFAVPDRASATGTKQATGQLGSLVVGIILGPIAALLGGWRAAIVTLAAFQLIGTSVSIWAIRRTWQSHTAEVDAIAPAEPGGARAVPAPVFPDEPGRRTSVLIRLRIMAALMGVAVASVLAHLPHHAALIAPSNPALPAMLVATFGVAGAIGRLAWGSLLRRFPSEGTSLIVIVSGGAVGLMLTAAAAGFGAWVLPMTTFLLGLTLGAWLTVGMFAVIRMRDTAQTGRISGSVMAWNFVGLAVGPLVVGGIISFTHYAAAWAVLALMLVGLLPLLSSWPLDPSPQSAKLADHTQEEHRE